MILPKHMSSNNWRRAVGYKTNWWQRWRKKNEKSSNRNFKIKSKLYRCGCHAAKNFSLNRSNLWVGVKSSQRSNLLTLNMISLMTSPRISPWNKCLPNLTRSTFCHLSRHLRLWVKDLQKYLSLTARKSRIVIGLELRQIEGWKTSVPRTLSISHKGPMKKSILAEGPKEALSSEKERLRRVKGIETCWEGLCRLIHWPRNPPVIQGSQSWPLSKTLTVIRLHAS